MLENQQVYVWYEAANGLKLIQFSHFNDTGLVSHGISTRLGGSSKGQWATLNTGFTAGDDPVHVRTNRGLICEAMGLSLDAWTNGRQQHTDHIQMVKWEDRGRGAFSSDSCFSATDGLMTNRPGILLAAFFADCVPLLYLDPEKKVIAAVHAGWKGTAKSIAAKALEKMGEVYGTRAEDVLVGIGPAIGPCCYEVDKPVIRQFPEDVFGSCLLPAADPQKAYLDLFAANRQRLIHAGVKPENIQVAPLCTSCHTDLFFSHRKEKGRTGRLAAVIALKE